MVGNQVKKDPVLPTPTPGNQPPIYKIKKRNPARRREKSVEKVEINSGRVAHNIRNIGRE